ncbi:EAL domain-containing protein [Synechococcus sp. ATX 2A4]|uniref:EAL domain-containing protein n=1 Tax=Synechococcus sp. ATX 2A4 TaxID=2823727 RepID=UPI0020CF978C|nr:EAL domain-containing protein [Synechococcus sp. ATX 2A4]MCP9885149.1 EAL domain-containing protein [Synechococcus sp. ATX 2A4]
MTDGVSQARTILGAIRKGWPRVTPGDPLAAETGVFGLVATATCALLVLTIFFLDGKLQQAQRIWKAESNLLQMRVDWHRLTAKEWAQKDQINAFVVDDQSEALKAWLESAPILQGGQNLLIADARGRVVFDSLSARKDEALSPAARQELQRCMSQKLAKVLAVRRFEPAASYGWVCLDTHVFAIGAAAGVQRSEEKMLPKGWVFHFSQAEVNDYDAQLLRTFRDIRNDLSIDVNKVPLFGTNAQGLSFNATPVFSISELEPPSTPWRLQQTLPWQDLLQGYGMDVLAPWLILCLGLTAVGLLHLRSLRHTPQPRQRKPLIAPPAFRISRRKSLPESLQPTPDLADALPLLPALVKAHPMPLLVVLSPLIRAFDGSVPSGLEAQSRILVLLADGFEITFPAVMLCRSPELALVAVVPLPEALNRHEASTREELVARVQSIIDRAIDTIHTVIRVDVNASLTWLQSDPIGPQILGLIAMNRQMKHHCPPAFLNVEAAEQPALLRSQISQDFEVARLAENFIDHHYRLEDVIMFVDNEQHVAYREMLFSPSKDNHPDVSTQDLIHSLERTAAIHLIDRSMLRKALSISAEAAKVTALPAELRPSAERQRPAEPLPLIATNLSALTIQSELHRDRIIDLLEGFPLAVRRCIVVEITETALLGDENIWLEFFRCLGRLGVRVAIDDFGCGHAALSYLFRYQVDFIKVDLQYARLIHDRRVNAMVEFLLSFEVGYPTRVIMEGIESQSQLTHWRQKGVTHFQGYLFDYPAQA